MVLLLIYGNLRGIKEAGKYFAIPTYFYVVALMAVILIGYDKAATGSLHALPIPPASKLVDGQFGTASNGLALRPCLHPAAASLRQRRARR